MSLRERIRRLIRKAINEQEYRKLEKQAKQMQKPTGAAQSAKNRHRLLETTTRYLKAAQNGGPEGNKRLTRAVRDVANRAKYEKLLSRHLSSTEKKNMLHLKSKPISQLTLTDMTRMKLLNQKVAMERNIINSELKLPLTDGHPTLLIRIVLDPHVSGHHAYENYKRYFDGYPNVRRNNRSTGILEFEGTASNEGVGLHQMIKDKKRDRSDFAHAQRREQYMANNPHIYNGLKSKYYSIWGGHVAPRNEVPLPTRNLRPSRARKPQPKGSRVRAIRNNARGNPEPQNRVNHAPHAIKRTLPPSKLSSE